MNCLTKASDVPEPSSSSRGPERLSPPEPSSSSLAPPRPVDALEAPAVRAEPAFTGRRNVKRATVWGQRPAFQIAPIYSEGVHTGWRALCGRHVDGTGRALPCRKTVNCGSGLSDGDCILRLKRWLVAGFNDGAWGDNKRSFHVSQGGWQLGAYSEGLSERELDARVQHQAAD